MKPLKRYTVEKTVDAYVIYHAEVEANSAKEAAEIAYYDGEIKWELYDTNQYDAHAVVTLDENGEAIPETEQGHLHLY